MAGNLHGVEEFEQRGREFGDERAVITSANDEKGLKQVQLFDFFSKWSVKEKVQPKPGETIVDFGAGVGRISLFISPFCKHIFALEPAASLRDIMQKKIAAGKAVNITVVNSLQDDWGIATNSVDKIFTFWVLAHINDEVLEGYLKRFRQILRPDGVLCIFEQTALQPSEHERKVYFRRTNAEYQSLLKNAGFRTMDTQPVLRMPSYARHYWSKLPIKSMFWLSALFKLEKLTLKYKAENVEYYTTCFKARAEK